MQSVRSLNHGLDGDEPRMGHSDIDGTMGLRESHDNAPSSNSSVATTFNSLKRPSSQKIYLQALGLVCFVRAKASLARYLHSVFALSATSLAQVLAPHECPPLYLDLKQLTNTFRLTSMENLWLI